jgi:diguanylate cyclase (GGDEF)-like protein
MNRALQVEYGDRVGSLCYEVLHQRTTPCERCKLPRVLQGETVRWETAPAPDGRVMECINSPLPNSAGRVATLEISRDITERKRMEEAIRHLAYHDVLTGLPNRALLSERLALELTQRGRRGSKLAVMLLDLDGFKDINDRLGHTVGDLFLRGMGTRLTDLLHEDHMVVRMGGDEFVLVLPGVSEQDVTDLARSVLAAVEKPLMIEGHELHVTTSIGVAISPDDGEDVDTLLRKADIALYRAKNRGRDTYQVYAEGEPAGD